jgi:hypothetical protein
MFKARSLQETPKTESEKATQHKPQWLMASFVQGAADAGRLTEIVALHTRQEVEGLDALAAVLGPTLLKQAIVVTPVRSDRVKTRVDLLGSSFIQLEQLYETI